MDEIGCLLTAVQDVSTKATSFYNVTDDAKILLEHNHNVCNDWNRVLFMSIEALSPSSLAMIRHCHFYISSEDDIIILGEFLQQVNLQDGVVMPSGLYYSTFSGRCIVSNNCLVSNTLMVKNAYLADYVSIVGCGKVICDSNTRFGNCSLISVGPENGGRNLMLEAGIRYSDICRLALSFSDNEQQPSGTEIRFFVSMQSMTIFGSHAQAFRCDLIRNIFAGSHSQLSCSSLNSCTLVSTRERPIKVINGSRLQECILHEGCSASNGCIAERAYLLESASIGDNARIVQSIIGPDSSVAGGECHHSIIGPFVGFHHHSLLIATLWPLGRGNLGYGCMNGSNHTGRVNDQECWLGEGCFIGLGAAVKFPSNFLASPYSLIAATTVCPPQKLCFPFSLLLGDANGKLQIKPGWVLYASPYTIERASQKFSTRRKSRQHNTGFAIMRRTIVDLVRSARRRLQEARKETAGTISGAGAGVISAADIQRGIEVYSSFIQRYALYGLLYVALCSGNCSSLLPFLSGEDSAELCSGDDYLALIRHDLSLFENEDPVPNELPNCFFIRSDIPQILLHQLLVLRNEFSSSEAFSPLINALLKGENIVSEALSPILCSLLSVLVTLEEEHAHAVEFSKERDNDRGKEIIDDYPSVNMSQIDAAKSSVGHDGVVAQAFLRLDVLRVAVRNLSVGRG